ncbi:hypothetical protein N802_16795 [Knoellia sinensis KCTC 19936]|uniref:Uncharacterized protein n=1 Tax=Knoellia sinensis KCTC 19936 TaxID=1385520 RepID=A0A0A0J7B1_9MICO|nr:PD40 domain-containing protein [Knoellia sinensis]KGN32679.1 hypothetical protein N802_16795 [Knoellia sinensis KCTC 19936]
MTRSVIVVGVTALLLGGCADGTRALDQRQPSTESVREPSAGATTASRPMIGPGDPWLAYEDKDARIHLVRADGTGDHELLPQAAGPQDNPVWSPDGQQVAFTGADPTGGPADLWVANVDGSGLTKVADCTLPCQYFDDPTWSADGGLIFYSRHEPGPKSGGRLEQVNLTDRATSTLITAPPGEFLVGAEASPSGRFLVAEWVKATPTDYDAITAATLTLIDLSTTPVTTKGLTDPAVFAETADWSPNGEHITYDARVNAGSEPTEIFTVKADGTGRRQLTDLTKGGGTGIQPTFSADGSFVDFVGSDPSHDLDGLLRVPIGGGRVVPTFGGEVVSGNHPRWRPLQ